MALYHEGYFKARQAALEANEEDLLSILDSLYGRDSLEGNYTLEELRGEALAQLEREFTDRTSQEYEMVDFWRKVIKAERGTR